MVIALSCSRDYYCRTSRTRDMAHSSAPIETSRTSLRQHQKAPGTIYRETQLLGQAFKLGIKRGEVIVAPYIRRLSENNVRRWVAREYRSAKCPSISKYVFHRNGMPIRDPRRSWAAACKVARLMKPKLDKKGEPVTEIINGKEQVVMVPARIFHDLRRSGVRNMLRAGVREGVAMAISGHRTRAIFDRYNITSDDDLRQALKQTQARLNIQPAVRTVVAISEKR